MNRRPTPQDITWLLDLNKNGQLDLDPPYQRRSVWTRKDRQFFLDTIFRNYPCPAIFLHKDIVEEGKTIYHVVDGKQRLQTIFDFVAGKLRIADDFGDIRLNGKRWSDLQGEQELKYRLWNYTVTVEFLDSVESGLVNNVFDRLNRNSRKLTAQELRHARFEGWFITTAETEERSEDWKRLYVVTNARATRMVDTQFISELMLVVLENKMLGFDQELLDELYGKYDDPENPENPTEGFNEEDFTKRFDDAKRYLLDMEAANGCIAAYTKQFYAFYTLWAIAVLSLAALGTAQETSVKYSQFMEKIEALAKEKDLPAFLAQGDHARDYADAYAFYTNTRGANTDLQQRRDRYDALLRSLSA